MKTTESLREEFDKYASKIGILSREEIFTFFLKDREDVLKEVREKFVEIRDKTWQDDVNGLEYDFLEYLDSLSSNNE